MLIFPCKPSPKSPDREWVLTMEFIAQKKAEFPHLNVDNQIQRAYDWLIDMPHRRKTSRGMPVFLNRWLRRADYERIRRAENKQNRKSAIKTTEDGVRYDDFF